VLKSLTDARHEIDTVNALGRAHLPNSPASATVKVTHRPKKSRHFSKRPFAAHVFGGTRGVIGALSCPPKRTRRGYPRREPGRRRIERSAQVEPANSAHGVARDSGARSGRQRFESGPGIRIADHLGHLDVIQKPAARATDQRAVAVNELSERPFIAGLSEPGE
jgi:hypothetical protein